MFPEGVKAMVEAVDMIASGDYPKTVQPEEGATYDPIWKKKECGKIDWAKMDTAVKLHNFIRGNDSVPGAWCTVDGEQISLYDSSLYDYVNPADVEGAVEVEGCNLKVVVAEDGIIITCPDGNKVCAGKFQMGKKVLPGASFLVRNDASSQAAALELDENEAAFQGTLCETWSAIISVPAADIADDTDFFDAGAGSMDVVRLIEETKQKAKRAGFKNPLKITADEVQNASTFADFTTLVVGSIRGGVKAEAVVHTVDMEMRNGVDVKMPHQLFINGASTSNSCLTHFSALHSPPLRLRDVPFRITPARRMLIGACNPVVCPIHVFRPVRRQHLEEDVREHRPLEREKDLRRGLRWPRGRRCRGRGRREVL